MLNDDLKPLNQNRHEKYVFSNDISLNSNELNNDQNKQIKITIIPNFPPFFPLVHYDPKDLPLPFNQLIKFIFFDLFFLIFTCVFNLITLSHLDISNFSYNSSFYLSIIQCSVLFYFIYSFSYKYIYNSCFSQKIPFDFIYMQFAVILFSIYMFIGHQLTGFAGILTFLNAFEESDAQGCIYTLFNTLLFLFNTIFNFAIIVKAFIIHEYISYNRNIHTIRRR